MPTITVKTQAEFDALPKSFPDFTYVEIRSPADIWIEVRSTPSNSQVEAYGSSQVVAFGSSQVEACGSSQVMAYDSSQVRASDSSQVVAFGSSQVEAYGSSQVTVISSLAKLTDKRVEAGVQPNSNPANEEQQGKTMNCEDVGCRSCDVRSVQEIREEQNRVKDLSNSIFADPEFARALAIQLSEHALKHLKVELRDHALAVAAKLADIANFLEDGK